MDDIQTDYYMHQHFESDGVETTEDDGFDEEAILARLDAGDDLDDFEEI